MSSIEAVLELIIEAESLNRNDSRLCFLKNKIEKDLEILEFLKKKMSVEIDYYDSDFGCEAYEYIAYNGVDLNIETQEEFNLLKEWLRNAK